MQTIHITDNNGQVIDIVKRKIHDLIIHHAHPDASGLATQSGFITYKSERLFAILEQLNDNDKRRWTAYDERQKDSS